MTSDNYEEVVKNLKDENNFPQRLIDEGIPRFHIHYIEETLFKAKLQKAVQLRQQAEEAFEKADAALDLLTEEIGNEMRPNSCDFDYEEPVPGWHLYWIDKNHPSEDEEYLAWDHEIHRSQVYMLAPRSTNGERCRITINEDGTVKNPADLNIPSKALEELFHWHNNVEEYRSDAIKTKEQNQKHDELQKQKIATITRRQKLQQEIAKGLTHGQVYYCIINDKKLEARRLNLGSAFAKLYTVSYGDEQIEIDTPNLTADVYLQISDPPPTDDTEGAS